MKKNCFIALSIVLISACTNKSVCPVEDKIDDLISIMTLDEKIGQLNQLNGNGLSDDIKTLIISGNVGSILNEVDTDIINELQRTAIEDSRLGIPLIFARDVIHGFKTIFPIPLGQASSWNPGLIENAARISAIEASSVGIRWTFAPMIDIARDPRWGRIAESLGEDPYLTSTLGVAMIKGFQDDNLSKPTSMAACAKHFAGYGAAEAGKDYNTTWIPEPQLRDLFLPPFKKAVDADVATFMCSFNDINGVPSSGNKHLNIGILRNEWKFNGVLVSDWASIEQMIPHGVAKDMKEASKLAIEAAVDIDMMSYAYIGQLKDMVLSGTISEKVIDNLVRNVLRLKFRLGLFDNPYVTKNYISPFYSEDALRLARKTAVESVILLKNNNNILPLSENIRSVAIIGPLSDAPADQLGTWVFDGEPGRSITPLKSIQDEYGQNIKVIAEKGLIYSRDKNMTGIERAVAAAKQADVILLFLGEESILSGEAHCLADISLPGAQTALVKALKKTGKPIITTIMSGRPNTIQEEVELSDAVLVAFHGGTMAGPALSDLIFGKEVPSGKLPVTFPKMVGQIPIYYAHKMTGRPTVKADHMDSIPIGAFQTSLGNTSYHMDAGTDPLFPFGYGLSYTTFDYSDVILSKQKINKKETLTISCNITNTGMYDASEVVQLYVRDVVASLARPVRELKGFQKIHLKAGETEGVSFTISPDDIGFWNLQNKYITEPGEFQVWISKDSQSGQPVSFFLE